jgi:hypothetical protein
VKKKRTISTVQYFYIVNLAKLELHFPEFSALNGLGLGSHKEICVRIAKPNKAAAVAEGLTHVS